MKRNIGRITLVLACLGAVGAAQAAGKLNLYNWSGYIAPELLKQFEQENDVKVNVDNYDSEETLLAKLKQGGAGYDVAVTSLSMIPVMVRENLIEKIGASSIPGYSNIIARLRKPAWDPTGEYSVPYLWGTMNFAVDTNVYKGDIHSWQVLFNPPAPLRGKVNMFDSADDAIALAAIVADVPFCTEDPKQMQKVLDVLKQQKPFIKTYSSKAGAIREALVAGEIAVSSLWSGSTVRATELKPSIKYAFPKEGSLATVDNLVVPKGAPNMENAKRFMAFMMTPKAAAANTNFLKYQNAIEGAEKFVDPALLKSDAMNPPAGAKYIYKTVCSEVAIRLHDRVWTNLLK